MLGWMRQRIVPRHRLEGAVIEPSFVRYRAAPTDLQLAWWRTAIAFG
jgi:hypothetical protein